MDWVDALYLLPDLEWTRFWNISWTNSQTVSLSCNFPCLLASHTSLQNLNTSFLPADSNNFSLKDLVLIDSVATFVLSHERDHIVNLCVAFASLAAILSSVWVKWSNLLPFPVSLPCLFMLLLDSRYNHIRKSSQLGIILQKLHVNESKSIPISETLLQWICMYVPLIRNPIPW